jgi:transposase
VTVPLQRLIGVDKKNPYFSICRDASNPGKIYVYFGAALMEVIAEDTSNPEFKLLIARLYNAGVKAKSITEKFGIARTTMKRWADALKSGDTDRLMAALSGQGAPRKLTAEILSFIKVRFLQIYQDNHYNYSMIIRKEIKEIFGKEISSESLRPIFKELRSNAAVSDQIEGGEMSHVEANPAAEKGANKCDSTDLIAPIDMSIHAASDKAAKLSNAASEQGCGSEQMIGDKGPIPTDNPKQSLVFYSEYVAFCYHVGVLIFSNEINGFDEHMNNDLSKQFLLTVLLGAKNIEQTKLLDFNAVKVMLGMATSNRYLQRTSLSKMSTEGNVKALLQYNAQLVNANQYTDFYYDPHVKHYSGAEKILKGWCPTIRSASKIINMDFIHTAPDGHPVYVETTDNFYDIRERFIAEIKAFRDIVGCEDQILTFIVDRGIYSFKVFETIVNDEQLHIVTWEKGYKKDKWDEQKISGEFSIHRARNNRHDLRRYDFEYIDQDWAKKKNVRQIIVRATNPKRKTIEVSILTDDTSRKAEEMIELMFCRWVQENDFKYSQKHFGINEITSYSKISYKELKDLIEDKQIKRGEYKAYEKEAETIRRKLKNALYKERTIKSEMRREELKNEIKALSKQLELVNEKKSAINKEGSKIDELIERGYQQLNTSNKKYMDCIKIIARNIFYKALEPFKEKYDNYRDDHVIFRNLTQAHGVVSFSRGTVNVTIFPTAHLQPKVRKIVQEVFQQINSKETKLPDGSGRKVYLELGKRIDNALFEIKTH